MGRSTRLLGYCGEAEIAAAGPVVLAPDGRIADSGVAVIAGVPLFMRHGESGSSGGAFGFGTAVFNVTAVGEMLATRRETFEALGGLRAQLGDLALIDDRLRAADKGLRTVTVADARVRSCDAERPVNDLAAVSRLRADYGARLTDPYYNPGFRADRGDFIAFGS